MKIAIASGKGGTGKTTLAVNLALYLAETQNTLLCDLDVEEPNTGLFLEGEIVHREEIKKKVPHWDAEKCTLCGKCSEVCQFNAVLTLKDKVIVMPQLCHSCYACSELCPAAALPMIGVPLGELIRYKGNEDSLQVVEGRLNIGEEQAVPLIAQTIAYAEKQLEQKAAFFLYDSPPGTSCPMIEAVKGVDLVLLITEPTPFGLHDFSLAHETLVKLKKPFAAVINRVGIGSDDLERYCEIHKIPVAARIPQSRDIAERYARGEVLYKEVPEFRKALQDIKEYIS